MSSFSQLAERGFLDPLPPIPGACEELHRQIVGFRTSHKLNPIYGTPSLRDLHLISIPILRLVLWRPLLDVLRRELGQNLIVWRSQVFYKRAGASSIGWHQEWGEFRGEESGGDKPAVRSRIGSSTPKSLTVWIPLQDTNPRNGALQFIAGSHRRQLPYDMVDFRQSAFHQGGSNPQGPSTGAALPAGSVNLEQATTVTAQTGQPVVFSERTLHRSLPNHTQRPRLAVNFRVTSADNLVYPHRLHGDWVDSKGMDVSRHCCVLVSGRQTETRNVMLDATHGVWGPASQPADAGHELAPAASVSVPSRRPMGGRTGLHNP